MDQDRYIEKQEEILQRYEGECKRCGSCCGIGDGDPCANLLKSPDGTYYCRDYEKRLGVQTTVSGKVFTCVLIRELFKYEFPYPHCAYAGRGGPCDG